MPAERTSGVSDEDGHEQKRALKKALKQWELEFEEAHGGLVPTHEDKKHDAAYLQIKTRAKQVERKLDHTRKSTRKMLIAANGGAPPINSGHSPSRLSTASRRQLGSQGRACGSSSQGSFMTKPLPVQRVTASDVDADGATARQQFKFEAGRISLSPFHVAAVLLSCALPYALFCGCFSLMGMGALVYDYLVSSSGYFYPVMLTAAALLILLFLFDVSYWEHPLAVLARRLLLSIAGGICVVVGALVSKEYPYAPLLLLFFLAPGYWWFLHSRFLSNWPLYNFLQALFYALTILSVVAAGLWVAWVLNGNNWDLANKRRYQLQMRCCHSLEQLPQQLYDSGYSAPELLSMTAAAVLSHLNVTSPVSTSSIWDGLRWPTSSANVSIIGSPSVVGFGSALGGNVSSWAQVDADVGAGSVDGLLAGAGVDESGCLVLPQRPCLSVLLFWCSPFVTACAGLVAAALCALLARKLKYDEEMSGGGGVSVGGRIFILSVTSAAAALWMSASIAGASMEVSKVILQGGLAFIVVAVVLIDRLFGWKNVLQAIVNREPLARRLVRFLVTSDYSRAACISVASPLLVVGIVLSIANQFIRVHMLRSVVVPSERALLTTLKVDRVMRRLRSWNWTSVLRKVVVLCLLYMIWVVVVMKVTFFFFSWLTHVLMPLPLAMTTGLFVCCGMAMFLLPPVPGAPVYMCSGVLLTAVAKDRFGFWPAALYSMGVAFFIKLGACALQQKVIGANLGRSVKVRSFAMVNTPLMRALKLLMLQPGILTKGKVATLVGGPDWPISVLMGILGMPLAPILGGTLPVICLVAPLSLSGSFWIMGTQAPYPALRNIALAVSFLSQTGPFIAMLHYVERISQTKRDQLEAMPYDLEVMALDRAEAEYQLLYKELTDWNSDEVPTHMRAILVLGALLGIFSCQISTIFHDECFRKFALYPDFPTQLRDTLGGKVENLVELPGYAVLGATMLSYLCRRIFMCWANRLARARFKAGRKAGDGSHATKKTKASWELKQAEEENARREALAQRRLAEMAPVLQMQEARKQQAEAASAAQTAAADESSLDLTKVAPAENRNSGGTDGSGGSGVRGSGAGGNGPPQSERAPHAEANKERPPRQKPKKASARGRRPEAGGHRRGHQAGGGAAGAGDESNKMLAC